LHPTIVVLQGALGTADYALRTTGFAEAAARRCFTAVFPDGIDRQRNDATRCPDAFTMTR
jgi:polyhydroxybutyrate depolymerase